MRRMVVKYREAEKLLKKVNEKLTTYADIFEMERKLREREKTCEQKIGELKKEVEKLNL